MQHAGKSSLRQHQTFTQSRKGTVKQRLPQRRSFLSRLHLSLSLSPSLEGGWQASCDASTGSLTYFRKYHRFLLIAVLSSRPLCTSPTGPTNSLLTSSRGSPFSYAHVKALLHHAKIKTATLRRKKGITFQIRFWYRVSM